MGGQRTTSGRIAAAAAATLLLAAVVAGTDRAAAATAGAIGNRVWADLDGDSVQDPGEGGVGGVRVTLSTPGGKALVTGFTDGGGWWGLRNLTEGVCYRLAFTIPGGYRASPQNPAVSVGGSVIGPDGVARGLVCATAEPQTNWDAGLIPPAPMSTTGSIGGRVLADVNHNGVADAGDVGLADVPIAVRSLAGAPLLRGVTGPGGWYRFRNLAFGRCYRMAVTAMPAGYRPANASTGGDGTWATQLCPALEVADLSGVSPLLTNAAVDGPPPFPTWFRHPGGAAVEARVTSIATDVVGGQQRLVVRIQDPLQPSNGLDVTLAPRPGLTALVPGRYVVTPGAQAARGSVASVATGSPECTSARRMTANVHEIAVTDAGAVTRLSMDLTDTCTDVEARIAVDPLGAQRAPDADADGTEDTIDNCPDVANADQADSDRDGIGTACDPTDAVTSVQVTSPAGEPIFGGGSFSATPADASITWEIVRTTDGPVVNTALTVVQPFKLVARVVHVPAPGLRTQPDAVIELFFRVGDRVFSGGLGGPGSPRSNVLGRTATGTLVTCPGGDATGTLLSASNLGIRTAELTFDLGGFSYIAATTTQQCDASSPLLQATVVLDVPVPF